MNGCASVYVCMGVCVPVCVFFGQMLRGLAVCLLLDALWCRCRLLRYLRIELGQRERLALVSLFLGDVFQRLPE